MGSVCAPWETLHESPVPATRLVSTTPVAPETRSPGWGGGTADPEAAPSGLRASWA